MDFEDVISNARAINKITRRQQYIRRRRASMRRAGLAAGSVVLLTAALLAVIHVDLVCASAALLF